MSAATLTEHPVLEEIVRQETDGGRLIVQFYLGVAYGTIDGFRDHHRAAAARRIEKIAPGLVKEYLLRHHNEHVRESMRGSRFPMGSKEPTQDERPEPRGPNPFQRRLNRLVRHDTGDGRSIVDFLIGVMEGYITGFKPHHRLEAANQLANLITSYSSPSVVPAKARTQETGADADLPLPTKNQKLETKNPPETQRGGEERGSLPSVVPAKARTQRGGEERGTSPSVVPAKAGTQRGGEERGSSPSVVPAKAGTQRGGEAQDSSPSVVPAKAGTQRGGEERGSSPSAIPAKARTQKTGADLPLPTKNQKPKTKNPPRPRPRTRTHARRAGNARPHPARNPGRRSPGAPNPGRPSPGPRNPGRPSPGAPNPGRSPPA